MNAFYNRVFSDDELLEAFFKLFVFLYAFYEPLHVEMLEFAALIRIVDVWIELGFVE
jgi:hypothetical protein